MRTLNQGRTTSSTNARLFVLVMMLLLSGFTVVGQNVNSVIENTTLTGEVSIAVNETNAGTSTYSTSENSNMNLFSWFMGTKQTPNSNLSDDSANSVKKQMINSGIEPNRILIKTFLKKATIYTEAMA